MKKVIRINGFDTKQVALSYIRGIVDYTKPQQVTIEPETRKLSQNAAQWPILNAIADQVQWPINGMLQTITGEDFKQILTAAWRKEQVRVAQGVDGGVVLLGHRTREFKASEWGEWMEYLNWFAAEKGVKIPVSKKEAEAWGVE
jgi:hypothetical protein